MKTLSLRTYLLLLVLGTMVPVLIVAAMLVRRVVADNRDAIERRLLETARGEAALVDAELGGSIRALQGLAQSDHLTNRDLESFYGQAQRLLATQTTWGSLTLANAEGRQVATTQLPLGQPLPMVADRESFQRAIATKEPAIGNLRVGQITRQHGFSVRVPVVRGGQVTYVLSAWITSPAFSNVLRRQPAVSDEWSRGVTDADGVVVARSREADRFVGQKSTASFLARTASGDEGVYRNVALDGTLVHSAFSRAPLSRWVAGVAVPADVIEAPFRQSMIALTIVTVLLLGAGGGAAFAISHRIEHDMALSTAEADRIASGEPSSHPRSRVAEVQRLLDALSRSSALLQTRERERDEQVERADAARATAEAADRAKDEFLAMLGHELRNPLAPALTALQLMKIRGGGDSRERDVVERQIRHLSRLVDDLLDVSRLRRGTIELRRERVDVADAVARAVEMTAPLFNDRQHQLEIDVAGGIIVEADRTRLAQVLSNLLTNAAKYTDPRGKIAIRARIEQGQVVIEVQDNGIGIIADLVPHVFDLFVQGARGLDRREGGLGLGLAVARTLVTLHGGTIDAKSDGPHTGSTFTVRLPLAAIAEPLPIEPGHAPAGRDVMPRVGRVMVVDDNADALEMLTSALQSAGIEVAGAATAGEALRLAGTWRPTAAVLDIGLPDMSGFDLARALRAMPAVAGVRLIALTGYGREQDFATARAAGFDQYFVKPMEVDALLEALRVPVV